MVEEQLQTVYWIPVDKTGSISQSAPLSYEEVLDFELPESNN